MCALPSAGNRVRSSVRLRPLGVQGFVKIKKSFSLRLQWPPRSSASASAPQPPIEGGHELFRPVADRYQRRLLRFVLSCVTGIFLVFVALFLPAFLQKWVGVPGIFFVGLSLVLFFTLPGLQCPSCGKSSDSSLDKFCPVCGKDQLKISALWGTRCDACGRKMGSTKYRNYSIRYCTHCGILLDGRGV